MVEEGLPEAAIEGMKSSLDCNLFFFDKSVEISVMYIVMGAASALLVALYIFMNTLRKKEK